MPNSSDQERMAVVVGGGLAGIVAARVLQESFEHVLIVEREAALGGLHRSHQAADGNWYDLGTHVVVQSGDPAADRIIMSGLTGSDWMELPGPMREGHYYAGRLSETTGCMDLRRGDAGRLERIRAELARASEGRDASTLAEQLEAQYGPTLAREIIAPFMLKVTGRATADLVPNAHSVFALKRFVAYDSERSIALKADPRLNDVLAYASHADGTSAVLKWYPERGGIERWIAGLAAGLDLSKVTIALQRQIERVESTGDRITSVRLDDGRSVDCDRLVWTAAVPPLIKAMGRSLDMGRPAMRDAVFFHRSYDRPLSARSHYYYCYDSEMLSYRITCYGNIRPGGPEAATSHLTVEAILDPGTDLEAAAARIDRELVTMGIADGAAEIRHRATERLPGIYVFPTPEQTQALAVRRASLSASLRNLSLVGRAATGSHFQIHVIREVMDGMAPLTARESQTVRMRA